MIKGIDVSHYQGHVDWPHMKAVGNEFCFLKATEGIGYTDSQFHANWINAPKAGLLTGAYHFFHPNMDPGAQADHFLKVVGPIKDKLPCVLDFEVTDNMRVSVQISRALTWLGLIESRTGNNPIVYCSPGFFEALGAPEAFRRYPLFVAHYGVNHPRIPRPWTSWSFWQYSEANGLDLDIFNGSLENLKKFIK